MYGNGAVVMKSFFMFAPCSQVLDAVQIDEGEVDIPEE